MTVSGRQVSREVWGDSDPCPGCGGGDITEFRFDLARVVRWGWECRDCGTHTGWTERK